MDQQATDLSLVDYLADSIENDQLKVSKWLLHTTARLIATFYYGEVSKLSSKHLSALMFLSISHLPQLVNEITKYCYNYEITAVYGMVEFGTVQSETNKLDEEVAAVEELEKSLQSCREAAHFNISSFNLIQHLSESDKLVRCWKSMTVEQLLEAAVVEQKLKVKAIQDRKEAYLSQFRSEVELSVRESFGLTPKVNTAFILGNTFQYLFSIFNKSI